MFNKLIYHLIMNQSTALSTDLMFKEFKDSNGGTTGCYSIWPSGWLTKWGWF